MSKLEPILSGIHHLTAICASPHENVRFYQQVLGLRLVKQTVNFDDPFTYHLYYGDQAGTPGTIITFFPWQDAPRGTAGSGMISALSLTIVPESLEYWKNRLASYGIDISAESRFGDQILRFQDPHGLNLELVAAVSDRTAVRQEPADSSAAIQGFHSATAVLADPEPTIRLLEGELGMTRVSAEGNRYRYLIGRDGEHGRYLDLLHRPTVPPGRYGIGTVHHIAFRTPSDQQQARWLQRLTENGYQVSPVRDRTYFKSIYLNEPGGILFEIATDPPGFTVDEPLHQLGSSLMLPDQFEPRRGEIERCLPPLRPAPLPHRFEPAPPDDDDATTLIALHGTGGDEHDLINLARDIRGTSAIISPRGPVSENGMNRYFARVAANLFEDREIIDRAGQLADFVRESANRYGRQAELLIALGYSNGANIAAALLFLRPELFRAAVLLRPMQVLATPPPAELRGKPVLITRGRYDRMIPAASTERLITDLRRSGSRVEVLELDAGHELTPEEKSYAAGWLDQMLTTVPAH